MARSIPGAPRFFYGWSIVAIAFVTMGVGVNARTAFSLFFPPILDEFGWRRGLTAGAFSFGFLVSAILGPILGRMMDRRGPRAVMLLGVALTGAVELARPPSPGGHGTPARRRSGARGDDTGRRTRGERRRSCVGVHGLDAGARHAHRALLVGRRRVRRRSLRVVRGPGAPDEVPHGDRLRARGGRRRARPRRLHRHRRRDRPVGRRRPARPHGQLRARVLARGGRLRGLRRRDVARGPAQGAGGCRTRSPSFSGPAGWRGRDLTPGALRRGIAQA